MLNQYHLINHNKIRFWKDIKITKLIFISEKTNKIRNLSFKNEMILLQQIIYSNIFLFISAWNWNVQNIKMVITLLKFQLHNARKSVHFICIFMSLSLLICMSVGNNQICLRLNRSWLRQKRFYSNQNYYFKFTN